MLLVATLIAATSTAAGEPRVTPAAGYLVVDAEGRNLGSAVPGRFLPLTVALSIRDGDAEHVVTVDVFPDRLQGADLYFSESGCQGQAHISPATALVTPAAVQGPRDTLLVGEDEEPTLVRIGSFRRAGEECTPGGLGSGILAVPARAVLDLADHFTPPFRLVRVPLPRGIGAPTTRSDFPAENLGLRR